MNFLGREPNGRCDVPCIITVGLLAYLLVAIVALIVVAIIFA